MLGFLLHLFRKGLEDDAAAKRQSDPRSHDRHPLEEAKMRKREANFTQLAGERCRTCRRSIVIHDEGILCERCHKPIHRDCAARHLVACGTSPPPYR